MNAEPNGRFVNIRIKATGQVTEMVPDVARALLASGMAEKVDASPAPRIPESMAVEPVAERAVAAAQDGPRRKPRMPARPR